MEKKKEEQKKMEETDTQAVVIKSLIGILLALFIVVFVVTALRFIPATSSLVADTFSALFNTREKPASFSSDRRHIMSGEYIEFGIQNAENRNGIFALQYPCANGVTVSLNNDTSRENIPCGKNFYLAPLEAAGTLNVSIESAAQEYTEFPIELYFEGNQGDMEKVGEVVIEVENRSMVSVQSEPIKNSTPTQTQTTTSVNTAYVTGSTAAAYIPRIADLSVRILNVGIIDRQTNIFIPTYSIGTRDRIGIQFEVANIGNAPSGVWSLSAVLPIEPPANVYVAPLQTSLPAGGRTIFTIGFEGLKNGQGYVVLSANPGTALETNKANNTASANIVSTGGTSNSGHVSSSGSNPDLTVRLLDIGRMSGNRFTARSTFQDGDDIAVKFTVENIGGRESGTWRFEAELEGPRSKDAVSFRSIRQATLAPGQSTEIIVVFEDVRGDDDDYDISIKIDPDRDVNESRRNNNTLTTDVYIRD